MAKLQIKSDGMEGAFIDLRLGVTRIGRSPDADFRIDHPTVSSFHCDLHLSDGGVSVRDLESTNGTFIDGKKIRESRLLAGQILRLGDVVMFVESIDADVAIPKFVLTDLPAPPVVRPNGGIICPRHPHMQVTYQCTACKEVMCDRCVHQLRRKGSKKVLLLCPICSAAVEPIGGVQKPRKKSLFTKVGETVKMTFKRTVNLDDASE